MIFTGEAKGALSGWVGENTPGVGTAARRLPADTLVV